MSYAIINYHYIRDRGDNGIHPCTIAEFRAQVNELQKTATIVSPSELYKNARANRPGRFVAFTFDDGLKEHYTVVFPFLHDLGIRGAFFPLELPVARGIIPLAHKLHIILGKFSTVGLIERLEMFVGRAGHVPRDRAVNPARRFDDLLSANLKESLIALPYSDRSRFVDELFRESAIDEQQLARDFFLTHEEIRSLLAAGMEIGSNTSRHIALDTLAPRE